MAWQRQVYPQVGEEIWRAAPPGGPEVLVVPKPGFARRYATFSTRYGSNDRRFIARGGQDWLTVPAGIAHFLEHQLFDHPERNILEELTALGASPNAYTGHYYTVYLISAVDRWVEAFDRLLEFVQRPAFRPESVRKEQGIIEQEIRMYQDNPFAQLREALLEALYHRHPVRDPILGTVDDIRRIDPELLFACHRTFYHPANMTVMVTGDVDREAILAHVERRVADGSTPPGGIRRELPDEPESVARHEVVRRLNVSRPYAALGVKLPPLVGADPVDGEMAAGGRAALERIVAGEVALEALCGRATPLYQRLYEAGVITDTFWYRLEVQPAATFIEIGGQSDEPERLLNELKAALRQVARQGPTADDFERARRAAIGSLLAVCDHLPAINGAVLRDRYLGLDFFARADVLQRLKVDDGAAFWAEAIRDDRLAFARVERKAGAGGAAAGGRMDPEEVSGP